MLQPDALADVLDAALLDLLRQEGVRDGGPRGADHVQHALANQAHHPVRGGVAPHPDHRLRRELLDEAGVGLLEALLREAGGDGVVVPVAAVDVPEIGKLSQHLQHLPALALREDAPLSHQLVDREAHHDAHGVADRLLGVLDDLAQQPRAVLHRTPVLVAAMVVAWREEVHEEREIVGRIHTHDVEARLLRVQRGTAVPAAIVGDVGLRHRARMDGVDAVHRPRARRHRHLAARHVARVVAHVGELDRGEAPVPVHELRHARERGDIALVPQTDLAGGLGGGVDVALLGAHDRPAPFGLHPAHHRHRGGMEPPHAVAVGHLVEAVASGDRTDLHRLEEDVVTGIAGHDLCSQGSGSRNAIRLGPPCVLEPGRRRHPDSRSRPIPDRSTLVVRCIKLILINRDKRHVRPRFDRPTRSDRATIARRVVRIAPEPTDGPPSPCPPDSRRALPMRAALPTRPLVSTNPNSGQWPTRSAARWTPPSTSMSCWVSSS